MHATLDVGTTSPESRAIAGEREKSAIRRTAALRSTPTPAAQERSGRQRMVVNMVEAVPASFDS